MTTPSDKALALAQAWRNRFISERMNAYPDDGYEVCRAKAEADANDFEDALIAASNKRTPPAQAAEAVELVPAELEVSAWPEHRTGMIVGTVSGIKVTHAPSKISVICTSERSMHRNRDKALRCLAAAIATLTAPGADDGQ